MTRLWQTATIELSIKGDPLTQTQKGSKGDKIMKKIRSSKKGFTLAELLIVVAIIGVLVGISIPIFSAQLRKSRVATDQANARAAKAAFTAWYLDDDHDLTTTLYYDAVNGKVVADATKKPTGYGETSDAKAADNIPGVTADKNLSGLVVQGSYNSTTESIDLSWS